MIDISYLKNTWSSDPSHMTPTLNVTFPYFHGIGDYFVLTAMGKLVIPILTCFLRDPW